MKVFWTSITILFTILSLTCWISYGIWGAWWYPKTYEANLRLADDASLPLDKANYLEGYLQDVSSINGKPRFIFKRPDLNLEKQRSILRGLIKRFYDVAQLSPSEMAYQQGMYQLTGQEIDHQLARISGIFYSAKLRQSIPLFLFFYWGCWLLPIFACIGFIGMWVVYDWDI